MSVNTRRQGRDMMSIDVVDDGNGIDPADRDPIFDPFFSTRVASGGSGLGLSVARGEEL